MGCPNNIRNNVSNVSNNENKNATDLSQTSSEEKLNEKLEVYTHSARRKFFLSDLERQKIVMKGPPARPESDFVFPRSSKAIRPPRYTAAT